MPRIRVSHAGPFEDIEAGAANIVSESLEVTDGDDETRIEADSIEARVDALERLVQPAALSWTGPELTLSRSGTIEYDGSDSSVELSGVGPHVPGAVVNILFPAGSINSPNIVTMTDTMGPLSSQADGSDFDDELDYRVFVVAIDENTLSSTARAEVVRTTPPVDVTPPEMVSATVENADPDSLVLVFDETVTIAATTGFSLPGHTFTGVSGSGTTWTFSLGEPFVLGESRTLSWDETNVVVDGSDNALLAGSLPVTNNVGAPSITAAEVNADTLVVTFSEAVTVGGLVGLSLDGTAAEFLTVASGSGTSSVTFTLDADVAYGETVTMSASILNQIESVASSTPLQPVIGYAVTNNTPAGSSELWSDDFNRGASATLDNGWVEGHEIALLDTGWAGHTEGHVGFTVPANYSYSVTYNMADALPADNRVTATIPHSMATSSLQVWGIATRVDPVGDGLLILPNSGIKVINAFGAWSVGNSVSDAVENIALAGVYPPSWAVDQDHTVTLEVIGTTANVYLDGVLFDSVDISSINARNAPNYGVAIIGMSDDTVRYDDFLVEEAVT